MCPMSRGKSLRPLHTAGARMADSFHGIVSKCNGFNLPNWCRHRFDKRICTHAKLYSHAVSTVGGYRNALSLDDGTKTNESDFVRQCVRPVGLPGALGRSRLPASNRSRPHAHLPNRPWR